MGRMKNVVPLVSNLLISKVTGYGGYLTPLIKGGINIKGMTYMSYISVDVVKVA